jgi:Zn-dependent M28 family amino/carboxypeptidase
LRSCTACLFVVFGGLAAGQTSTVPELRTAAATITPSNLVRHIRELSSDAYDGRLPGTRGEEKSVAYVISQIKTIGLQPGSPTGGFVQKVPLYGTRSRGTITITAGGKSIPMAPVADFVLWSNLPDKQIDVLDSDLVFAGYGVVAPEHKWDDYAGMDVKGKTVMVITGDPPVADPRDPTKLDERVFLGRALTIFGRNGTKVETAFKRGAAAVLLVPPAQPLRYVWENNQRENMTLRDGNERKQVKAQAFVATNKAAAIFAAAGANFDKARAAAAAPGFHSVAVSARVTIRVTNQVRSFESQNVLAKIEGSDPVLGNEYVIYTGHWDHHGREGDRIFHGASDNAAGTAGVLELARAFRSLNPAPKRTVIFLWPTAEEKGLLGSHYYATHPLYPLAATVANINLDYFSNWGWGRTRDFSIIGIGNSTLDDLTAEAVRRQGRVLTGDTAPDFGFYFRSDHYEFARVGVPSLETSPGIDYVGKPSGFGETKRAAYIADDYHNASDVMKSDWDLRGAVEDLQILLEVGYRTAQQPSRPTWKPDAVWRPRPAP